MSRISLTEQYNNKDVIAQIYDVKDKLTNTLDDLDAAAQAADSAATAANSAVTAANNAVNAVNNVVTRTTVLEGYTGSPSDAPSATGSLYARVKKNANDIANNNTTIGNLVTSVADVTAQSNGDHAVISTLPTTYQLRSEKDTLNGYAGIGSNGKIATSEIDTGVNLNQVLKAGAQLNTGEFLYVDAGGIIRSRVIGEGVKYIGNYASLAALQSYANPENGDFGTVYGSTSDDGFYMYDGTNWNKVLLFDATDYELIANKVTGISSASTDTQYPSAKAVYDFELASDVANMTMSQTVASGGITVTTAVQNINGSQLAGASVVIPTTDTPTASSNVPITSGGVKTAIDTVTGSIASVVAGKQDVLTSVTITLAVANWSSNAQTVTGITNVTATNIVWVSPSLTSYDEYAECGVRVTVQGSGSLTFECTEAPTNDLTVTVVG